MGAVPRPRLFRALDRLRRKGAALWVSGQPGSGKTTLVATWIAARRLPAVWLRADAADAELATFFHHLSLAVRAATRRPVKLPALTPGYPGDLDSFARAYFRGLHARLRPGTVLVFDDCHEVPDASAFFGALRAAVEEVVAGISIVLVGRGDPPAALARLRASGALGVLAAGELDLTAPESLAVARARGVRAPRARIEALRRSVHGWPAGLALLLERVSAGEAEPELHAATADYFGAEVLDDVDPATRRVLLEAALLDTPSAELVARATGEPGAARILASLARRGLFTLRRGGEDPAYELHALFRRFLLERGREELPPGRAAEVRRAAAAILAARGGDDAALALELLLDAGAFAEAALLVAREAPALLAAGRSREVGGWIGRLPAPLRASDPWLLLWGGAAEVGRDPDGARARLEQALALFEARGDAAGVWLSWAAVVEATLHAWTDFSLLARRLDELDGLRRRLPIPSREIEVRVMLAALAALVHHAPEHPALAEWSAAAEALALGDGDPGARLTAGALLQMSAVWWFGDVERARPVVAALGPVARAKDVDPVAAIQWLAMEAPYHVVAGDVRAGARAAQEARRLAEASGVHVWDVLLYSQAIWGALGEDEVRSAQEHVAQVRVAAAMRPGNSTDRAVVRTFEAAVSLRAGDPLDVIQRAREAKAIGERHHHPVVYVMADLLLARAHACAGTGACAEAEAAFASAREKIGRIGTACFGHVLALAEADRAVRGNDPAGAAEHLARAVALAHAGAAHSRYFFSRAELADLLAFALARGVHPGAVRALVLRHRLRPPVGAGPEWPWAVRISALGPFEVESGRDLPPPARKAPRRPLELLKALVALGGREVPEEAIAAALWPGSDGDAAHHALETTLYRLRRLLGADLVLARDRRLSLAAESCFVDAVELDRRLRASLAALGRRGGPDPWRAREDAAAIVALYRGPLLAGEEAPWAQEARARLRGRLSRWVEALGTLPGDPADASGVRRTLGAADPDLAGGSAVRLGA